MPRNQEMMRIFKDIELVEHLGSGIPRILEAYPKECFKFTENFLRMTFPNAWDLSEDEDIVEVTDQVREQVIMQDTMQDTMQVTMQVKQLIIIFEGDEEREVLQKKLSIKNRDYFRKAYIKQALFYELIEMTIPEKPNSRLQKYRLTPKGINFQNQLKK